MTQLNFTVDNEKCIDCGACIKDCICNIINKQGNGFPHIPPGQESDCLECQHCMAVCPAGAISIFGLNPEDSLELKSSTLPSLDQESTLIRGRRSVRQYRAGNVEPELIRQLLATVSNAPTGVNNRSLTFILIDDEKVMHKFREQMIDNIEMAQQAGRIHEQQSFLTEAAAEYRKNHIDELLRGAPHMLIVSAKSDAPCPNEDVVIALAYFELLAQSAGLGTLWCGLLKLALEAMPELKTIIGLPQDHVYYSMLFGYPSVKYARTVQRDSAAIIRNVKL